MMSRNGRRQTNKQIQLHTSHFWEGDFDRASLGSMNMNCTGIGQMQPEGGTRGGEWYENGNGRISAVAQRGGSNCSTWHLNFKPCRACQTTVAHWSGGKWRWLHEKSHVIEPYWQGGNEWDSLIASKPMNGTGPYGSELAVFGSKNWKMRHR